MSHLGGMSIAALTKPGTLDRGVHFTSNKLNKYHSLHIKKKGQSLQLAARSVSDNIFHRQKSRRHPGAPGAHGRHKAPVIDSIPRISCIQDVYRDRVSQYRSQESHR